MFIARADRILFRLRFNIPYLTLSLRDVGTKILLGFLAL